VNRYYLSLETNDSLGFPIHLLSRSWEANTPAIIYLHGFTGSKESHLDIRIKLADLGFLVVSFDAREHGMRRPLPELWNSCRENFTETFSEILLGTVDDAVHLYQYLSGRSQVDPRRIALAGGSMGAMVCLMAIPRLPTLRAAVCMAGTTDLLRWQEETAGHELYQFNKGKISPALRRQLREYEAFNNLGSFFPTPLLMLHGALDELVPPRGQEALFEELRPFYRSRPELLCLRQFAGLGHETSPDLLQAMAEWLRRHVPLRDP
jgi:pimeloyl-ACP methyl ester carboxylesterase